jgi:hypothetical protein
MSSEFPGCLVIDTTSKVGKYKLSCFGNDFGRPLQTELSSHNVDSRIVLVTSIRSIKWDFIRRLGKLYLTNEIRR